MHSQGDDYRLSRRACGIQVPPATTTWISSPYWISGAPSGATIPTGNSYGVSVSLAAFGGSRRLLASATGLPIAETYGHQSCDDHLPNQADR